jgi:hypothetical protein
MKWTDVSVRTDNDPVVVAMEMTKDQLQALPEYELRCVQ